MPHPEERRTRPLSDQLLLWLAPLSLALNLYFVRELYQDVRQIRTDVQQLTIEVAVLKATVVRQGSTSHEGVTQ